MANLEKFNRLVKSYSTLVDFAIVYIAEAHPEDGWKLTGNKFTYSTHKSLEERLVCASDMVRNEPQICPVVVDDLSDEISKAYSVLPERLYIILNNSIVYAGGPGPIYYKLKEVEEWLFDYETRAQINRPEFNECRKSANEWQSDDKMKKAYHVRSA